MVRIRLSSILEARGLSQRQLALKAGIRPNALSAICNEKVQRIDLDILDRICTALELQPGDLFEWLPGDEEKEYS
ncbi:helix-turn-helix transcriptional regulator [Exiguobacterium sp. s168]|uniref:helix-turn-helix domain-containing protein n=1 Tax=Exiguobacterium sp. s168 TaxID=2751194 RepID=UPI001BE8AADA|nr:helix-turn-helix transcriptional regulator [Exiguobacterium sp. s168]